MFARPPSSPSLPAEARAAAGADTPREAAEPGREAGPLREAWYFALPAFRVRPGTMVKKTILGEPILFARDAAGAAFALRDICPHRGMPLSCGAFDGTEIECCYHGWRFDSAGLCTAIPSLAPGQDFDPGRVKVRAYPVREVQGNIWVYTGSDPEAAPPVPVLPDIGERGCILFESVAFRAPIDHAIIGLMDPAHGPFVHRSWWWRSRASIHAKEKAFAPSPWGFTMLRHAPSSNSRAYRLLGGAPETEIAFRLPGVRIEHIRAGRHVLCNLTAVTPLEDGVSEVNHAIYGTMPWLKPLAPLFRPFVRRFLRQDRDIMVMQQEGLRHDPPLLLINDADTQAKWYHRLKQEYLRARAENRPFANPVKPRTLRWRS
jgi:phenylpropionate dioxygenase-like ring-hydroxylating dioxygenase large terminal subunit